MGYITEWSIEFQAFKQFRFGVDYARWSTRKVKTLCQIMTSIQRRRYALPSIPTSWEKGSQIDLGRDKLRVMEAMEMLNSERLLRVRPFEDRSIQA